MDQLLETISRLAEGESLTLGSDTGTDIVLTGDGIAPRHARLTRRLGQLKIQDLDTDTGTFVNDREVRGLVAFDAGDRLRLGRHELPFGGTAAVPAPSPKTSPIPRIVSGLAITLDGVTVTINAGGLLARRRKDILMDAGVHIAPGQFVGILGASGSGKSTLIKAIAGLNGISGGRILLDGQAATARDLQQDRRIAYLPQDVVIHEEIAVRRALGYIAELKGAAPASIAQIVADVAKRTGLIDHLDVPIRRLSGGQRKRAALAGELIGDPRLILLDEATSGLDPATEAEMMHLFRSLADEGRTVVCITHFPNRLALCDRLIYLMDARVVFVGPPAELQQQFGTRSIEEIYIAQADRSAAQWRQQYEATAAGRAAAGELATAIAASRPATTRASSIAAASPAGSGSQTLTLLRRYAAVQRTDWPNLLLLFLQAPVIGGMVAVTYGSIRVDFAPLHAATTKEVIFLLVIATLWCSGMAAVREIVKEQTIVRHEVRFGMGLLPYLFSKLVLLSGLALAQAAVLLWVVRYFTELTGGFPIQFVVVAVTAAVGLALGLLVSAAAGSSERAMTILPVVLIMQAIFSGGIARLTGVVELLAQATVPAYWALDGIRSTFTRSLVTATYPNAPGSFMPPILGAGGPVGLDLLALLIHGTIFAALAYLVLSYKFRGWMPARGLVRSTGRADRRKAQKASPSLRKA